MPSSGDDVDLNLVRPRSRLVQVLRIAAIVAMLLYSFAIIIGRFMHVNVGVLTVTGIWDLLVRLFALF